MELHEARSYFYNLHDIECNQKYNKTLPYSFHLNLVSTQVRKYENLLTVGEISTVLVAAYGHDSIEDARVSYNDIKQLFGEEVAEIIYLCTENKGRSRADRKNDIFYQELATNELAVFVKLCDLTANMLFSLTTNSSMFRKYSYEYTSKIRSLLYINKYDDMYVFLDKLIELN